MIAEYQPAHGVTYDGMSWQHKRTTFCSELTFHSPPLMSLLSAPTLGAGECKMSGGESKLSSWAGLPRFTRSSLEA
jgi:hypothetical protein